MVHQISNRQTHLSITNKAIRAIAEQWRTRARFPSKRRARSALNGTAKRIRVAEDEARIMASNWRRESIEIVLQSRLATSKLGYNKTEPCRMRVRTVLRADASTD
jgi:hypothetical protein